jgi:hypothetical protein
MATSLSLEVLARNSITLGMIWMLIVNTEIKGFHDWRKNQLEWGVKYTRESIL